MKAALPMRYLSLLSLSLAALLVAGCGGGGKSGAKLAAGDVAVVQTTHITESQYNDALSEEKASIKSQGQAVPAAGSTQYVALKTQVIDVLVQQAEFALEAKKLGIVITPAQVDKQLTALKKKYFAGSEAKYQAGLKQQGFTDAEVRTNLMDNLLEQKLYNRITKSAKATPAEVASYYQQNLSQYQVAPSRAVREILVGKNKETLANQIYTQLKGGASFATLAKKYSQDPGSKDKGGTFTANEGQRRAGVRQGGVLGLCEDRRPAEAGQDGAVRLVRDPGAETDRRGQGDDRGEGCGVDPQDAQHQQAAGGHEHLGRQDLQDLLHGWADQLRGRVHALARPVCIADDLGSDNHLSGAGTSPAQTSFCNEL